MVDHRIYFACTNEFQVSEALSNRIHDYVQEQLNNSETGQEEEEEDEDEEKENEEEENEDETVEEDSTTTPGLMSFMYRLFWDDSSIGIIWTICYRVALYLISLHVNCSLNVPKKRKPRTICMFY